MKARKQTRGFLRCEDGFSTLGMAVCLLVTLSLLFSSAQVYRVNSASAEIQEVADAAALAAENTVAEFMVAVRVCDAVVLTLSLTALTSYGLGVVAVCIPPTATLGEKLIELGGRVLDVRDNFANRAAEGLNALQKALPFLAIANAASIAQANSGGIMSAQYSAFTLLVPSSGSDIVVGTSEKMRSASDAVENGADELADLSEQAEQAAEEASLAKERGFMSDCGNNPAYCMYERAASLSSISAAENPLYESVDAWSFSVALERAKAYYPLRLSGETPLSDSVEQQANSALRTVFYTYAVSEIEKGYVNETETSFEAYFPLLPKNTSEMRQTSLYFDVAYPYTFDAQGTPVLHAWSGCPQAANPSGTASISQMEAGEWPTCASCEFTAASLGKVAAASTSISNGFEYHYNAVAQAAADYERARETLDPLSAEVKQRANSMFDGIKEALESVGSMRIDASPPGAQGIIALVVNLSSSSAQTGFENTFVTGGSELGTRAAVAASTLLAESSEEGKTVLSSLLDGYAQDGGAATGAVRIVLDCWSALLGVYAEGHATLENAIEQALNNIPLISKSGLGTWASQAFSSAVEAVGLAPAKLDALKPVLVNSAHVAQAGTDTLSARYVSIQAQALSLQGSSTSLFASVVSDVEGEVLASLVGDDGTLEIATVEFVVGGVEIPVTITLPPALSEATTGVVQSAAQALRSAYAQVTGVNPWQ